MAIGRANKLLADYMAIVGQVTDDHTHSIVDGLVWNIEQAWYNAVLIMFLHSPFHFYSSLAEGLKVHSCIDRVEDAG